MLIYGNGYITRTNAVMYMRFSEDLSIGNDQIISKFWSKILRPRPTATPHLFNTAISHGRSYLKNHYSYILETLTESKFG